MVSLNHTVNDIELDGVIVSSNRAVDDIELDSVADGTGRSRGAQTRVQFPHPYSRKDSYQCISRPRDIISRPRDPYINGIGNF
jgi:hypothetical protein